MACIAAEDSLWYEAHGDLVAGFRAKHALCLLVDVEVSEGQYYTFRSQHVNLKLLSTHKQSAALIQLRACLLVAPKA